MPAPEVCFEGVWKKFFRGQRHDSLRDLLPNMVRGLSRPKSTDLLSQEFWAVKDVSFEVGKGSALGIIGANGAGKSTTLKLLTRILRPTKGHVQLKGRVAALIEVAAGFHPDLTGRENIYLQGAIMGMSRSEIGARFSEIVDFAGMGAFIDTPAKRYSSGMNARLGFAIAAHVEPDILIIDEVLAVGDMAFQQRAFARISKIVQEDTAVVVVSHQLDKVAELCTSAILLAGGAVVHAGSPSACIREYLRSQVRSAPSGSPITLTVSPGQGTTSVDPGEAVTMSCQVSCADEFDSSCHYLGFRVRSADSGTVIMKTGSDRLGMSLVKGKTFSAELELQMNTGGGLYLLEAYGWDERHSREFFSMVASDINVRTDGVNIGTVFLRPTVTMREN